MPGQLDQLLLKHGISVEKKLRRHKPWGILVVDDEPAVRDSVASALGEEYKVYTAADGDQAVSLLKQHTEDIYCVVMDAKMPNVDGFDATRTIYELDPELPIIMLTAQQDKHTISEVVDYGFSAYITKGDVEISSDGQVTFPTIDRLKKHLRQACSEFADIRRLRFFQHVIDPAEKAELLKFSMLFDTQSVIPRKMEDHYIAGYREAERYCKGVSYPENADYIFMARELDITFGLDGKKVMEFCTGPGDLARVISSYNPEYVVGVDGSEHMIRFATEKHASSGATFSLCNLFDLTETSPDLQGADIIVCQNSMHHFSAEHLRKLFKAAVDCLNIGGSFYVADYRREHLDVECMAQRLLATNRYVREDLVHTFQASLTVAEIESALNALGDGIEYQVFYPDEIYAKLKQSKDYYDIISADPHPHYLDYKLSLRVLVTKLR